MKALCRGTTSWDLWAAAGLLVFCSAPAQAEPPRLGVAPSALDFGLVTAGDHPARTLTLRNDSAERIEIGDVGADCRCLRFTCETRQIAPHGALTGEVHLEVCGGYLGQVRRRAWLRTQGQGVVSVPVRYRVVPAVFTEPDVAALGLIDGEPVEVEIAIRTLSAEPIRLLGVEADDPALEVRLLDDRVARPAPARLRLRLQGPVPVGHYQPRVTVHVASEEMPNLRVPVWGESVPGLRCDQREIDFGDVRPAERPTQHVEIRHDGRVQVGPIRTSGDAAALSQVSREEGMIRIALAPGPRLPLGDFAGYLVLEVNDGRNRTVRIPYRGRVLVPRADEQSEEQLESSEDVE